jgi:hypothetical protein
VATQTPTIELITQVPDPTQTQVPSLQPSLTLTPTRTQTFSPHPTIPSENAYQELVKYVQSLMDCEMPCFWGIIPGETTFRSFHQNFLPFDGKPDIKK